jgi:hypothetical protein
LLAGAWGVSVKSLVYRSREFGLLSDATARRAYHRFSQLRQVGFFPDDPVTGYPGKTPSLLAKAFALAEDEGAHAGEPGPRAVLAAAAAAARRRRPTTRFASRVASPTLKTELVYTRSWSSRHQLESQVFSYIEGFYNPRRRDSRLGNLSPDTYDHPPHPGTEPGVPPHRGHFKEDHRRAERPR